MGGGADGEGKRISKGLSKDHGANILGYDLSGNKSQLFNPLQHPGTSCHIIFIYANIECVYSYLNLMNIF